jgi:type I restriction enzyme S subunit
MRAERQRRLGEICTLLNGRAFQTSEWSDEGLPIIRIQNLNDASKPFNYYQGSLPDKFRVRPGDILLSWSGTPGTSFGCFRWRGPEGWLNQHIFNVRLTEDVVPDFFVYQVGSLLGELISRAHGGVGLQHVTKPMLEDLLLWIPSRADQERIVQLLHEARALRTIRVQADERADEIIPALFHRLFSDSESHDIFSLEQLLEPIDSGWSPVCRDQPAANGEWGVLKLSAVTTGRYLESENKALPTELDSRSSIEVKAGDVLFSRKNTKELVAATAYVWQTRPHLMLSDLIFRLRPRQPAQLDPIYLAYALKETSKRQEIQRLASGSAGSMPNISKQRLLSVKLNVPSPTLQRQFAARAAEMCGLEAMQATSRQRLDDLFQSLLHRAFEGNL